MIDLNLIAEILFSSIRHSIPLIFACLAGLWAERSGIVDIGLEGKILGSAFAAASAAFFFQSAWMGLGVALSVSIVLSLLHGYATISKNGNQVVSGIAINMLVAGLTVLLGDSWFREGGRTPILDSAWRFVPLHFSYGAIGAAWLTAWCLGRTHFGLHIRAVGDNPHAVNAAGIAVGTLRYKALIMGGILCGFAGTYLAIAQSSGFIKDMSAGRGFIALSALIFANWQVWPAFFTCLGFGFLEALSLHLRGQPFWGIAIPPELINALPYILTLFLLSGFIRKPKPPRASGMAYAKEHS